MLTRSIVVPPGSRFAVDRADVLVQLQKWWIGCQRSGEVAQCSDVVALEVVRQLSGP
jgi:hypothetical protein